jgi:Glyoxalase/Bleomycin resistance protein/Dioxygenase superfamily
LDVFRVRLVVEDFPAALRFYATPMDGACVTKAPDVEAARIWTGRTGRFGDDVDAAVDRLVRAGGDVVDEPRDVAPGATRFARVRAPDGCLVEFQKPQAVTLGTPLDEVA